MDTIELLGKAQDAVTVKRVFGEPITRDGVTVIPAARVAGGGGGGTGKQEGERPGEGTGGGFGIGATPAGMIIIKDGKVRWRPAIDVNKIIIGGQIVAIVALLTARAVTRAAAKSGAFRRK
ncbi:spore germination protein GerW family protein [Thermopolyspora sp. NPDC052614]|uniref:spore germination protein GerW family protein n=1 Tax=Thermopolyspora sp. NPDC052614 TaxID=3155682 RepID=UPI00342B9F26